MTHLTPQPRCQRGFTIIEILVVLAIVVGFFSIIANVFRSSFQSESRRFGRQLQGVIKYYYNQAILTGHTYRLVISFPDEEGGQPPIIVEMAEGPFVRAMATEEGEPAEADVEEELPEEAAPAEEEIVTEETAEDGMGAPPPPPPPTLISPTKASFVPIASGIGAQTKIPKRVRVSHLCLAGQEKPVETGKAHIYFYPNGSIDAATIVLTDANRTKQMVLMTNPITGHTDIRRELPKEGPCAE